MNLRSSWVATTGQTREDTRLTQMGATTPVNPIQVRSGVLPGTYDGQYRLGGFWLSGDSGAMSATVHEGRAVIEAGSGQGAYPVTLPEQLKLTFADGDASYDRIDVVVLHVYDDLYDKSGFNKVAVEIIQGTAAPTPAAPPLPQICLPIYQVTVRHGASAGTGGIHWDTDLTDLRTTTVAIGGILPAVGDTGTGAYPGQYRDFGGALQRWDGSAWVSYPSALGGIAPAGAVGTASYTGQYRDTSAGLQRWNGSAWVSYQPTWTDYTPVWGAETGTAPSIGNGTLAGSYVKINTLVHVRIYLKIGSTTNLSAQDADANWTFSLPAPPNSKQAWKLDGRVLGAEAFDASANLLYQGSGLLAVAANGSGIVRSLRDTLKTSTGLWDKSLPFVWAAGDVLSIHGTYESAS